MRTLSQLIRSAWKERLKTKAPSAKSTMSGLGLFASFRASCEGTDNEAPDTALQQRYRRPAAVACPFRPRAARRGISNWPDAGDASDITHALVWRIPDRALKSMPNLKVVFALGAGIDQIVKDPEFPAISRSSG